MSYLLIVSTFVCSSIYFTPVLIKYILAATDSYRKSRDVALHREMVELGKEMAATSVVNEFAKYTRLQRRHNKVVEAIKAQDDARSAARVKARLWLVYGNKLITTTIAVLMMYSYGREPVISLPSKLIWPFGYVLSSSTPHQNSIPLVIWMFLVRMVAQTFKQHNS